MGISRRDGKELTLDGSSAKSAGVGIGDKVTVGTPEGPKKLELVGLLRIPGGSFGGLAFGMVPLSFGQEVFDKRGQISGIAVEAAEGVSVSDLRDSWTKNSEKGCRSSGPRRVPSRSPASCRGSGSRFSSSQGPRSSSEPSSSSTRSR